MIVRPIVILAWALPLWTTPLAAQSSPPVQFGRDIQPILRERCYACHGPAQQMQGLRLDQRRVAMPNRVGANRASVVPGSSNASPLYLKIVGKAGLQMPPDGPLSTEQIELIKRWIDEGADWPDALAGETPASTPNPRAVDLAHAIRRGDSQEVARLLREHPETVKSKGNGGTTPLMYATLYGSASVVGQLLDLGADPNARNDANAAALMFAVDDETKTRLLLDRGADANARSDDGQTPLLIAASRPGAAPVVKLLLDHGADPSARAPRGVTALSIAANAGDADLITLLLARGADRKPLPIAQAVRSTCGPCADALIGLADRNELSNALPSAATVADVATMRRLLERGITPGADVLTSMALTPEAFPDDLVASVIAHGADINSKTRLGGTVLDLARRQGNTSLVAALVKAGATQSASDGDRAAPSPNPAPSHRTAVERSLPLLDRADVAFIERAGCVSCHNNSLAPLTRAAARKAGIPVNEPLASSQRDSIVKILAANRERAIQGIGLPGGLDTAGYILLGLAVDGYAADETTDAWARYLKNLQQQDGRWRIQAQRPPIESSDIEATSAAIRALQVYAPSSKRVEYENAIRLAVRWLETAKPKTTEDRAFLILGLRWARGSKAAIARVTRELLADQRPDGGWSQLPTLPSDAYATGQALVALGESGRVATSATAYRRGAAFLQGSQLGDGSWYVRTRTLPIQPYFDSGFPYGSDQFISTAATHWATMALARAAR
ncbi:MAG TPA: ankyrin repeat domain-containing protein [Vicinamibacterales bacterium]|jgi:ankyrin repeat protein